MSKGKKKIAGSIDISNVDKKDLAQLLEDTAKLIRENEHDHEDDTLFQRLDLGDFVILSHRS